MTIFTFALKLQICTYSDDENYSVNTSALNIFRCLTHEHLLLLVSTNMPLYYWLSQLKMSQHKKCKNKLSPLS